MKEMLSGCLSQTIRLPESISAKIRPTLKLITRHDLPKTIR
ncbi:hypothetical protein [Wielerella bovis]|nr:hypothetical protein [Wielerella bovis]